MAWHAPTDSPRGSGRAGRVAERLVLPVRPGNAGGGKEPQVRSDAQRDKGLGSGYAYSGEERCPKGEGSREWLCLLPRMKTGIPGSITCPSEGTALEGAGLSRRQQASAAHRTQHAPQGGSCAAPASPITCRPRLPGCSVCETHDPTGEPDAVNPPVRFGERRLETGPRRGVRHRHCESRR